MNEPIDKTTKASRLWTLAERLVFGLGCLAVLVPLLWPMQTQKIGDNDFYRRVWVLRNSTAGWDNIKVHVLVGQQVGELMCVVVVTVFALAGLRWLRRGAKP